MRREANAEAVYPPVIPEHYDTAANRINQHLVERFGLTDDGSLGSVDDPFYEDVMKVLKQAQIAIATLQVMKQGAFNSDPEPKYAGGVVAENCRIFTPVEAAGNTLEQIQVIEKK